MPDQPADHGEFGPSGKYYVVEPYDVQKRKHSFPPRGICRKCESNPVLRKDNCVREHNNAPWQRCPGSGQPPLGLPYANR
jgi:hypothetical protein